MTTHDAIKHLSHKRAYFKEIGEEWADSVNVDALEIAVRALAEGRIKGEWIKRGARLYMCSECARFSTVKENYCPTCGADMRVEEDDE